MMTFKRLKEKTAQGLFGMAGMLSSLFVLLIVVFLFTEGAGLFKNTATEQGYTLLMNAKNPVNSLTAEEIKHVYDGDVTTWDKLGGKAEEIMIFRIDDIFSMYSEEELGAEQDYNLLPAKLADVVAQNPNIIAFVPTEYVPKGNPAVRVVPEVKITPSDFFGGKEWLPTGSPTSLYGIVPLIAGTLWVSLFAILIALPLGLGVAIYLSELAGDRQRAFLKPTIELLAAIPSVVYGFFGLVVLVPLVQKAFDLPVGETALSGSIILGIMALPTIITVAEDAMRGTPRAMREASLALGASHWQTIYKVILPYAASGISAAVVLGIGRAIGETMAVLMVTGNAAVIPTSLTESVRTIPATIAAELGEAPAGGAHYQSLFLLGCVLFILTLGISIAAEYISKSKHKAHS